MDSSLTLFVLLTGHSPACVLVLVGSTVSFSSESNSTLGSVDTYFSTVD